MQLNTNENKKIIILYNTMTTQVTKQLSMEELSKQVKAIKETANQGENNQELTDTVIKIKKIIADLFEVKPEELKKGNGKKIRSYIYWFSYAIKHILWDTYTNKVLANEIWKSTGFAPATIQSEDLSSHMIKHYIPWWTPRIEEIDLIIDFINNPPSYMNQLTEQQSESKISAKIRHIIGKIAEELK